MDLGVKHGTLWAVCNIGAENMWEYGDYYAWGETETKKEYSKTNSLWDGVGYSDLKARGVIDDKGNLTAAFDVAAVKWGNGCRMPTVGNFKDLLCLPREWVEVNGVWGRRFIGKNGNTLFLPFAGYWCDGELFGAGGYGDVWAATACNDESFAYDLYFGSGWIQWGGRNRHYGRTVRAVYGGKQ